MKLTALKRYSDVDTIYKKESIFFPIIDAVIQKKQQGIIWHDDTDSCYFILSKSGFCQLIGKSNTDSTIEQVSNHLFKKSILESAYILWYNPSDFWQNLMDNEYSNLCEKRWRLKYKLDEKIIEKRKQNLDTDNQPDVLLILIKDIDILKKCEIFSLDLTTKFWNGDQDFLKNANAICLTYRNEPAAICYAASSTNNFFEIDIKTVEKFRNQHFGTKVAKFFISNFLKKNIKMSWDCFDYNKSSAKIAEKIGFKLVAKYPFYSVNRRF